MIDKLAAGQPIQELRAEPTAISLFRFSAVTWNPHRIHYDAAYAATEGYSGALVQSHLHGAFILECVLRWAPPESRLSSFSWQNRGPAIAGTTLTVRGSIESVEGRLVTCVLEEANEDGALCATGRATLELKEGPTS
ncbi:acyl dehydratase [Cryobacterium sp. TMS1-20-1]|uniref:MaoC/PaaZ C-terminal domain-containing protein n=1 Tax=Cryobacterium sp. TMS1-20-1 TaxID=1259223 RepID=UPI00106920A2|nr:MaoC/PaaZ C-terminal domain-containing protein [Cryobacterium sp. TMS1-20-1]TFC78899.1 acyl dehydratase [Cryobacterium sp. TMS1-20-1]